MSDEAVYRTAPATPGLLNIMVNSRSRYHYLAIEKGVLGVGQSGGLGHLGDMIGKVNC